jgi:AcrR family transcriptional regulator
VTASPSAPTSRAFADIRREEAGEPSAKVTPADAFRAAERAFIRSERIDMLKLAAELGISKATLYRWTGSREHLLSEVLTHFGEGALEIGREVSEGFTGEDRIVAFTRGFVESIVTFGPMRHFVRTETPLAFRLLTTRGGLVQSTVVRGLAEVMQEEVDAGNLRLRVPAEDLAYAMIRIIEGFIYNDAMADIDPDIDTAIRIVSMLID